LRLTKDFFSDADERGRSSTSTKAIRVAKVMVSKDVGRVPVIDKNGKLLGIVDGEDIA